MTVNKGDQDDFSAFLSTHNLHFCDNIAYFAGYPQPLSIDPKIPTNNFPHPAAPFHALAQQPTATDFVIPPGTTIKYATALSKHIYQINSSLLSQNAVSPELSYNIRILGSKEHLIVPSSALDPIFRHEPSEIPSQSSDADSASLQKYLTKEDLDMIWDYSPDSVSPDQRLLLH